MINIMYISFCAGGLVALLWYCVADKWKVLPKWIKCHFCAFFWVSVIAAMIPVFFYPPRPENLFAILAVWGSANIIYTTVKMNQ